VNVVSNFLITFAKVRIFAELKSMRLKLLSFFALLFSFSFISAQESPTEIKYAVMDILALRYYPFTVEADSIIQQVIDRKAKEIHESPHERFKVYQKTTINLMANKEFVNEQIDYSTTHKDYIYKWVVRPYQHWLEHARPFKLNSNYMVLTTALYEDSLIYEVDNVRKEKKRQLQSSQNKGLFTFVGQQNVLHFLDEVFDKVDLFKNRNNTLLFPAKGPLSEEAIGYYNYFLSAKRIENGEPEYEIVFFPANSNDYGFSGYLYVSADGNFLLKRASFTFNQSINSDYFRDILFVHDFTTEGNRMIPDKEKSVFIWGDEIRGSCVVSRTALYSGDEFRSEPLSSPEMQIEQVVETASQTRAFRNLTNSAHFLLTDHITIGGANGKVEWGPVTQSVSYNGMEGLRLRAGGNTSLSLNKQLLLGGYLAYGTNDKRFKYRGDFIYSFPAKEKDIWEYPKSLFSFSYVNDLNIPGEDLLTSDRDFFLYSFGNSGTMNMSLQKVGTVTYEKELSGRFSIKLGGKYLYDRPLGLVQYNNFTSTELNVSIAYAPLQKYFQNRNNRIYFGRGDVELKLSHRIGIKGILASDYYYHITDFEAYKQFRFPRNAGTLDFSFSAGKVWNSVPFPLLFIPIGNQSFILEEKGYNLMNYYEFITDNKIAGNVNVLFNWSPVRLIIPKNSIKISMGVRAIYGPLSDKNNPDFHPELFPFNHGVKALGKEPYVEANIGLADIFKLFRIEYVRRFTYLDDLSATKKGSILITSNYIF
jgi:hypothetical protein